MADEAGAGTGANTGDDDLSLLIDAARAAGEIARRFWRQHPRVWDKGGGAGPVTEADLAVNDHLHRKFPFSCSSECGQ